MLIKSPNRQLLGLDSINDRLAGGGLADIKTHDTDSDDGKDEDKQNNRCQNESGLIAKGFMDVTCSEHGNRCFRCQK